MRGDVRLLLLTRSIRAFGFGFGAVLLGIHLQARGLNPFQVGLALAVGVLGASLGGLAAAAAAGRWGRRTVLAATGVLMAASGLDLALAPAASLLMAAGLTGMMGVAGTDQGPFLAIEQALLTQASGPRERNRAFARYSLTGGLAAALGGLAAAGAGRGLVTGAYFLAYASLGLVTAVLPRFLSARIEGERPAPVFASLRPLLGLAGLFALDSLGGGLIVNSVLVYWLHVRFGASPAVLGPAFAGMSVLAALSFELSGRLADRVGLVNTMVFTHLPTSLMLFAVPFMPGLGWALGVLLLRSALQSMDIPARQAYIVSIVPPADRSGALAVTGAIRGSAQALGPLITGEAIQVAALGLPFLLGGVLKTVYDLSLYAGFRRRFGDHEAGGTGQLR